MSGTSTQRAEPTTALRSSQINITEYPPSISCSDSCWSPSSHILILFQSNTEFAPKISMSGSFCLKKIIFDCCQIARLEPEERLYSELQQPLQEDSETKKFQRETTDVYLADD